MPLFDSYIFADWSARNELGPQNGVPDAVWVGESTPADDDVDATYFPGRRLAAEHITERLLFHVEHNHRVLLGFDFCYGYPIGLTEALYLPHSTNAWWTIWSEVAMHIEDNDANQSNRFSVASGLNRSLGLGDGGPFWGVPADQADDYLWTTRPHFPFVTQNGVELNSKRITEQRLGGVRESWQLFGAGSVGSQVLVGIPYVWKLRRHRQLAHLSSVWPFETHFTPTPSRVEGPCIVHAEIWPGIVNDTVNDVLDADNNAIRDEVQVRALCDWASELDGLETLAHHFNTPPNLTTAQIADCVTHEGWILGTDI